MRRRFVCSALLAGLLSLATADVHAASTGRYTLSATVRGSQVEGLPLFFTDQQVVILGRDGYLWDFRPSEAKNSRKTSGSFHGYSAAEMRAALQRELGSRLEVTGTGHYLVAHPPKQGAQWAERFEELYRSFVHYFSVRGFKLSEPEFPLVAIVWTKQEDFLRYAAAEGAPASPNLLGYYSPTSNRVTLYDVGANGKTNSAEWSQNAATIIHEATHQTAFNTGIHSRYAGPPRWVAEGLGTLFEAPAIWDSRNPRQRDRINHGRLSEFRQLQKSRKPLAFVELLSSDRMFDQNPSAAYAEAWALTYYLVETDSQRYCQYLAKTAGRPAFKEYPAAQRLADFTAVFGENFPLFESHYLKFIAGAK